MALTKSQRKKALRRGMQAEIARELGVADSLVSAVVNGKAQAYADETVKKVREAIAARIGGTVEDVWGKLAA
jgi:predicted XRE-type DNA-binding protein